MFFLPPQFALTQDILLRKRNLYSKLYELAQLGVKIDLPNDPLPITRLGSKRVYELLIAPADYAAAY